MIERKQDRRRMVSSHFTQPRHERRIGADRRACAVPLTWSAPQPGAIRPGVGDAVPVLDRRRFADAGAD